MPLSVDLWYSALASPVGIIVKVDGSLDRAKAHLYALRVKAGDPDLECLSIVQSPTAPETELWILKRTQNAPQGINANREGDA